MATAPTGPLLVWYVTRVGSRLAIQAAAPVAAAAAAWLVIQPHPAAALLGMAQALFGPDPGPVASLGTAVLGVMLAGWAAPLVRSGVTGWFGHLPVSRLQARRAATMALVVAQAPLAAVLLVLAVAAWSTAAPVQAAAVVAVPVMLVAAAQVAVAGSPRWVTAPLGVGALVLAGGATWGTVSGAVGLVAVGELLAGVQARVRPHRIRGRFRRWSLPWRIALRALGLRLPAAWLAAALPVVGTWLFLRNNVLEGAVAVGAVRLGGGLAVVVLLASLAEGLASRRPAWPWVRSLPWSAGARVGWDMRLLVVASMPPLAASSMLAPGSLVPLLPVAALLAARAAGAVYSARDRRVGAAGEVLVEGCLLVAWVALVPLLALVAAGLIPWAVRAATGRERAQVVSRWRERRHRAAGDSLSWSQ